jgi:protein TonB
MTERKGLAIGALALGLVGLFTVGGFGVGSLVGLTLACVSLGSPSRGGRDVAWAALAANIVALLTVLPVWAAVMAYRSTPLAWGADDDTLPEPVEHSRAFIEPPPPPPPPPPPGTSPRERPGLAKREAAGGKPRGGAEPTLPGEPAAAPGTDPETRPLRVGGTIQEPKKTRNVNPVYPPEAIQARVQGVVILECTISPAGKVIEVKTLRGVPALTEAAVEAVRQWEYTPTLLNGVAVPVIMTVTVNFGLS